MTDDPLCGFKLVDTIAGWRCGYIEAYPNTMMVACPVCEHLSKRSRNEVPSHVCNGCGLTSIALLSRTT